METIFNKYKNAEIIFNKHNNLFLGCKRVREIINVLKVPEDKYIYAYEKNKEMIISTPKYCKAKLFIDNEWFNNYIDTIEPVIDIRPDEIILKDHECLESPEGKKYNIRVYGERDITKCFLSVKDIEKELGYEDLQKYIIREWSSYNINEDYKYFSVQKLNTIEKKDTKIFTVQKVYETAFFGQQKKMYLTYNGFIKMLYITKNKQAQGLRNWITKIIYTIHMGTQKERIKCVDKVLGCDNTLAKDLLKISLNSITCVYFIILGYRKNIMPNDYDEDNEDELICKFGFTKDLKRRFREHENKFNERFNTKINLKYYSNINETFLSEAERQLHDFFDEYKYTIYKDKELISFPAEDIKDVKKLYKEIGKLCIGNVIRLENVIKDKERDIENVIKDKEYEIKVKEYEIKNMKHEIEKLNLQNEILRLKLESKN